MKTLLFSTMLILCLMVGSIMCQEEEGSGGSLWSKFKKIVKGFIQEFKSLWNQFTDEMNARSTDMQAWTKEMFDSFKRKMKEWIDERPGASDSEKNEMREYLERMEMETE